MKEDIKLNLFFGQEPGKDFLDDFSALKNLNQEQTLDIIKKAIKWGAKGVEDIEFQKWLNDLSEDEKNIRKKAVRFFVFIFREFASGNLDETSFREDLKILGLEKYVKSFLKEIKENNEFVKKALDNEKPYDDSLYNLDWRIENRIYRSGKSEKIAFLELIYIVKGKKTVAQFSVNAKVLDNLIYRLCKIKGGL